MFLNSLHRKPSPLFYELGVDTKSQIPAFTLWIPGAILDGLHPKLENVVNSPFTRIAKRLGPWIIPRENRSWGYGEILQPDRSVKFLGLAGSGYRFELPIPSEQGTDTIRNFQATLWMLFTLIDGPDIQLALAPKPLQIMHADLGVSGIIGDNALRVLFAKEFARWLAVQNNVAGNQQIVAEIMQRIRGHLTGSTSTSYIRARWRSSGWVQLDADSDGCWLSCGDVHGGNTGEHGLELCDHNVDTPRQQLTLLAGAIKLAELARKDGF